MPSSVTANWTTPYDWVSADVLSEARLDAMNSNTLWLKSRVYNAAAIATTTTTSTSFVAMAGGSVSLTSVGGNVLIYLRGAIGNTGAGNVNLLDIAIDGVRQGDATNGLQYSYTPVANYYDFVNLFFLSETPPSAGAHTYAVYWKVSAGTITWGAGGIGRIHAFEFR